MLLLQSTADCMGTTQSQSLGKRQHGVTCLALNPQGNTLPPLKHGESDYTSQPACLKLGLMLQERFKLHLMYSRGGKQLLLLQLAAVLTLLQMTH